LTVTALAGSAVAVFEMKTPPVGVAARSVAVSPAALEDPIAPHGHRCGTGHDRRDWA